MLLVKEMDLVYRRVINIKSYVNSLKNVILRQHFAHHIATNVFAKGRIIVNFDECSFVSTTSRSRSYTRRGSR